MRFRSRFKVLQPILIAIILAAGLRAWAVALLPQDFDEPTYLQTAFDYASAIKTGDINAVIDYSEVPEHPTFVKLLYSMPILLLGKAATWANAFYASRIISALFGVLAVLFLALAVNPLAAGLLAVQTLAINYTSQVYLEAVPSAMMIAAVLAFLRIDKKRPNRWLFLSAVALGVATASKYSYIPVLVVVLAYLALIEKKVDIQMLLIYGLTAVATFFALDVSLWHQPLQRLLESLSFHIQYSQGAHVQEVGFPWYQPFIWIFTSAPAGWHPNVFFYPGLDGLFALLAVAGLKHEWKSRRWLVIWLVSGVLFLLIWPTKWPQYALIVTPAICIMAAETIRQAVKWVRTQENYWNYLEEMVPKPTKWLWLSLAAFVIFIGLVYLSAAAKQAIGRIGWSHITAQNSFLPSNTVYALLPEPDGRMVIGTDQGAAIWTPPAGTDKQGLWTVYNQSNSGLAANSVYSLAQDPNGSLWFGTSSGVSRLNGENWSSFRAANIGLPDEQALSITAGLDGRVFVGTKKGAATWDGAAWTPISELTGQTVFSLVATDGALWAGTSTGAGRLDLVGGKWNFYPTPSPVDHLVLDSSKNLWAATTSNGLARLDGTSWTFYSSSNSGIPLNCVTTLTEVKSGEWWVGTSLLTQAGGIVASFSRQAWHSYLTDNSGASGSEPLAITIDASEQVWIGTRTQGIDIYKLGR